LDFPFLQLLGSGLSSSTAFVCSSTIGIMGAFEVNFPKVSSIGRHNLFPLLLNIFRTSIRLPRDFHQFYLLMSWSVQRWSLVVCLHSWDQLASCWTPRVGVK